MLKATMLGAGISPPTAAPGPGDEKRKMAFAATQPQQSAYVPPTAAAPASSGEARRDTPTGGQKKYLPGDPMAPGLGSSSTKLGGRGSDSGTDPKQPSAAFLVGFGVVGMIVIAGVGLLVAKYMGLL